MKRIVYVAVCALMPLVPHSLQAQDPEDVLEAFKRAYEFLDQKIPEGRRVVAMPSSLEGRARELTISFAREVDLPLRGDLWRACNGSGPDTCLLQDADVLIGIARPEIEGDEARVTIVWSSEEVPGRLDGEDVRVRLVREDGEWKAVEIVSRSIS